MKKILLLALFILGTAIQLRAQNSSYSWDKVGISLEVPIPMEERENTETSYELACDDLLINIQLLEDPDKGVPAMKKTLKELSSDMGLTEQTDVDVLSMKNNGLSGVVLDGVIDDASACMAVILSADGKIELFVTVMYSDGMGDIARNILQGMKCK